MSEYIERRPLFDALFDADAITANGINIFRNFPTADVVPVVRGKWSFDNIIFTDADEVSRSGMRGYKCSECNGFCIEESNFCPNCGADMRGTNDEAEGKE